MKKIALVLLLLPPGLALGSDHSAALEKYLTDDVVAIGYLDLSQIDTLGALEWVEKLEFGPAAEDRGEGVKKLRTLQKQIDELTDFGVRYVYALFRVSDISFGGPTWVVPAGNRSAALAALQRIKASSLAPLLPKHLVATKGAVLGANTAEQLEQLKADRPTDPRDWSTAWKTLGSGHGGLLVFGDQDSRRVVREMFPKLPEPFQAIDGPWIADRLLWGGIVAKLPPEPSLQIIVQTDENSTAKVLQESIAGGFALLEQSPLVQKLLSAEDRKVLTASLAPQVSGDQVAISFADVLNDCDRIARLLTPPVRSARQAAQRNTRINQFKQIALAMLNYESANGTFPPRSTFSDDGKPLLSWRVHILPYLGQGELYKQFHLDEPWDSEHNKQLIPLMPATYADPDPALRKRNVAGRTTYVVPTGPGSVFAGPAGISCKEITDGTSNTILLVEIWSMAGPFWTRPKDWLMATNPWERLQRRDDRDWMTAAFCDGHVRIIPTSTSGEKLRALITIAGGEVIEWP